MKKVFREYGEDLAHNKFGTKETPKEKFNPEN